MANSTYATGTQTAVISTEHFLSSPNVIGDFKLKLDVNAMVAGDVLEIRCYQMAITGGTQRVLWQYNLYGAQPAYALDLVSDWISNDLTDTNALRFSITQTFGTGRAYPWSVIKADDTPADTYQAKVWLADDNAAGTPTDRYIATWFKNGQPYAPTAGTPQIQVIKASDGSDLIAATNMTQIASTGMWKYDATTSARIADGAAYIIKITATVDGSTRTWLQPYGQKS